MKLTLDREDLLPQHADVPCSATRFEMFKPDVRSVVRAVGDATFWEYDRSSYNRITVPGPALLDDQEMNCLRRNGKVAAIKAYRRRTGLGLQEAKDAVEYLAREQGLWGDKP